TPNAAAAVPPTNCRRVSPRLLLLMLSPHWLRIGCDRGPTPESRSPHDTPAVGECNRLGCFFHGIGIVLHAGWVREYDRVEFCARVEIAMTAVLRRGRIMFPQRKLLPPGAITGWHQRSRAYGR